MTREQFKEHRVKRGYTRRKWAEVLGIDYESVRSKEDGRRTVTKRDIKFIGLLPAIELPETVNEEHD